MKTITSISLGFIEMLCILCLTGCTAPSSTPPPQDVTLSLTSSTIQHSGADYLLICEAVLDNRTGQTLFVTTTFHSPFDHLRPVIYDEQGNLLYDGNDTNKAGYILDHRSPYHIIGKPYPLATGRSTNELSFLLRTTAFPVTTTANNLPSIKVALAGFLTGSTYPNRVKSPIMPVTATPATISVPPPSYFWQLPE